MNNDKGTEQQKRPTIRLKNISVKDVDGLTADIELSKKLTNFTGSMSGGRTRLFNAFYAMRAAASNMCADIPGYIKRYDENSRMSFTLTYDDDIQVIWSTGFRKVNDGITEEYYILEPFWRIINENGEIVCHLDKDTKEKIDDEHANCIVECIDWLTYRCVMTFKEAMEHLGKLPYGVLGNIGVYDVDDINGNIGRLIPWLCIYSDMSNCLVWMNDIFNSIHHSVVIHYTEDLGGIARREKNQFIMSCRCTKAMVDTYPCWFFENGKAVMISREGINERSYQYAFDGEDEFSSWSRLVDNEFEKVREDVMKALGLTDEKEAEE